MRRCVEYCICVGSLASGWEYGGTNMLLLLQDTQEHSRQLSQEHYASNMASQISLSLRSLLCVHRSRRFCLLWWVEMFRSVAFLLTSSTEQLQDCARCSEARLRLHMPYLHDIKQNIMEDQVDRIMNSNFDALKASLYPLPACCKYIGDHPISCLVLHFLAM